MWRVYCDTYKGHQMKSLAYSDPYVDLRSRVYEQLVAALYNISQLIVEVEQMMD